MIHAFRIPRLIAITPSKVVTCNPFRAAVSAALAAGLPAIMLRDKSEIQDADLAGRVAWLRPLTLEHNCLLIVNRRLELARLIDADGIHLGKDGASIADARSLSDRVFVGWSAHSVSEALRAFKEGADYVTLSPIYASPHKGAPLGLQPLLELTSMTNKPVIGLGGITPENSGEVIAAGAQGVAVIRAIFDQRDPAAAVRAFLKMVV